MKHHALITLCALILLAWDPAESQVMWFKYTGNPVITVGPPGSWDGLSVHPNRILREDTVYRMWYTGWDGSRVRIGLASSRNGITWTKDVPNPVVAEGAPGSWESTGTMDAYVVHTASGYNMWYTGVNASGLYGIGFATSPDGITWTKAENANPILTQASWYGRGPDMPSVLGPDSMGHYSMWFTGEPLAHADFRIGYATAAHETAWTPFGYPVLSYGIPGSWDDDKVFYPRVLKSGEPYEMFFVGEQSDGHSQLGYATSADGITWVRSSRNPVLKRGSSGWDVQDLYGLDVMRYDGLYHMWYGGTTVFGGIEWRGCYAISPEGCTFSVGTRDSGIGYAGDTVRLTVDVGGQRGPSKAFSARLSSYVFGGGVFVDTVDLWDDGKHGDSLASDGIYGNSWIPVGPSTVTVDLTLSLSIANFDTGQFETADFELNQAGTFEILNNPNQAVSEEVLPRRYQLAQNFPNPFNPATTIRYEVPSAGYVRLCVFDLLGREVAVLVNEKKAPGSYQVQFDAAGLASGVYLYRLTAGSFLQTRKMVVVR